MNFNRFAHATLFKSLSLIRGSALAFALVAVLGGFAEKKAAAAIYTNGTPISPSSAVVTGAQKFAAINNGPYTHVESYRSNGTLIDRFGGGLLTDSSGQNKTVATVSHGIFQARAIDPNAYFKILTGTNYNTNRGQEILVSEVLLAPGADGSLNTCDLAILKIPTSVNSGVFTIGTAQNNDIAVSVGSGFRLTQEQLANGTFAPRDGNLNIFQGRINKQAAVVNDFYMDTIRFQAGEFPNSAGASGGESGNPMLTNIVLDQFGKINSATYIGTLSGWIGDRLSPIWSTAYTTSENSIANTFLYSNIPEPTSLFLLGSLGLLLIRYRRDRNEDAA